MTSGEVDKVREETTTWKGRSAQKEFSFSFKQKFVL